MHVLIQIVMVFIILIQITQHVIQTIRLKHITTRHLLVLGQSIRSLHSFIDQRETVETQHFGIGSVDLISAI